MVKRLQFEETKVFLKLNYEAERCLGQVMGYLFRQRVSDWCQKVTGC